jgi:hypothetical protein
MITAEQLKLELSYNPDSGVLTRRSTGIPVYLERTSSGPRIVVLGFRMYARKAALAFIIGRYPEKHEYRFIGTDPMGLQASLFKRRRGDGRKDCALCGRDVELSSYHRNPQRKDKRGSYCVDCAKQLSAKHNSGTRASKYGMTEHEILQMSEAQDNKCAICLRPAHKERYGKLSVDHCHDTGKVRGMLCMYCNTALGKFNDSPRTLLQAAKYLLGKL